MICCSTQKSLQLVARSVPGQVELIQVAVFLPVVEGVTADGRSPVVAGFPVQQNAAARRAGDVQQRSRRRDLYYEVVNGPV